MPYIDMVSLWWQARQHHLKDILRYGSAVVKTEPLRLPPSFTIEPAPSEHHQTETFLFHSWIGVTDLGEKWFTVMSAEGDIVERRPLDNWELTLVEQRA